MLCNQNLSPTLQGFLELLQCFPHLLYSRKKFKLFFFSAFFILIFLCTCLRFPPHPCVNQCWIFVHWSFLPLCAQCQEWHTYQFGTCCRFRYFAQIILHCWFGGVLTCELAVWSWMFSIVATGNLESINFILLIAGWLVALDRSISNPAIAHGASFALVDWSRCGML